MKINFQGPNEFCVRIDTNSYPLSQEIDIKVGRDTFYNPESIDHSLAILREVMKIVLDKK